VRDIISSGYRKTPSGPLNAFDIGAGVLLVAESTKSPTAPPRCRRVRRLTFLCLEVRLAVVLFLDERLDALLDALGLPAKIFARTTNYLVV
jgi:hypothetical protein